MVEFQYYISYLNIMRAVVRFSEKLFFWNIDIIIIYAGLKYIMILTEQADVCLHTHKSNHTKQ